MIGPHTLWKAARRYFEHRKGRRLPLICCWLITNRCTLKCEGCYFYQRVYDEQSDLDTAQVHKILDRMIDIRLPVLYIAGGEPLMREDLFELMEKAKRHHILTVLYTNGLHIDEQKAALVDRFFDMAFVSIDGFASDHEILRGKNTYEPAMDGLKLLTAGRKRAKVGINYVITKYNADNTVAFLDFIASMNLDRIKIHPHYFPDHRPGAEQIRPVVEKLIDMKKSNPRYLIGSREYFLSWIDLIAKGQSTPCDELDSFINVGIMPDGTVSACGSYNVPLGNLLENSFEEILSGPLEDKLAKASECSGCYRYDAPFVRYVFETPLFKLSPRKILEGLRG